MRNQLSDQKVAFLQGLSEAEPVLKIYYYYNNAEEFHKKYSYVSQICFFHIYSAHIY